MTHGLDLHAIAREMKAAQDRCRQIEPFTSRLTDCGNTEAYAVAHVIHEWRMNDGAVPVGRKIGFTNPEMWAGCGVYEPIWACVYDTTLVRPIVCSDHSLQPPCYGLRLSDAVEPKHQAVPLT